MPAEFNWEDPLDLESQLTGDERMIRDSARAFCNDKLAPRIKQAFRQEKFDRAIMNELGEMGFLGVMKPEKYGGSAVRLMDGRIWPVCCWPKAGTPEFKALSGLIK